MKRIVLSLCDRTGNMVRPWADAGYECWCVDLQHPVGVRSDTNIHFVGADITDWLPPLRRYVACFAFPPCTHLAVSGARWFAGKGLSALVDGLKLVDRCRRICEWTGAPWMLENPVGTLSTYWRKPNYIFHPWHFGEPEQKATCLWTGAGFVMPPFLHVSPPDDVKQSVWRMAPSADRGDRRAVTSPAFAQAVFEANASTSEVAHA